MKISTALLLAFVLLVTLETNSQIISATRRVDWTNAGLRTPKPVYINTKDITAFGGNGDGITTNDAALQAAIASLGGANGTIYFPAGIFYFVQPVVLRSGLVLRGDGAGSTTLLFNLSTVDHLLNAAGDSTTLITAVANSAYKNQNSIVVANASLFQVNDYVKIYQNDASLVNPPDTYAQGYVAQVLQIQNITGNTITFTSPLRRNYLLADAPKLRKQSMVTGVGVECLKIKRLDAFGSTTLKRANINFDYAAHCWVKGVESDSCNYAHVEIDNSTNVEVTGSYFHGAFGYSGGGEGYGIAMEFATGECLIENNIFRHLRHAMLLQIGANGNVISYNYSREAFQSEGPLTNAAGDIVFHGNYPYANLVEGNIAQNIYLDASHGKNGPFNTLFRNRAQLYGISISGGGADSTNIVGNEITGTGLFQGNYSISGTNNFEHGNNKNGTILPAGTTTLNDASYYLPGTPLFWVGATAWPSIGLPNTINTGTNPAYARYQAQTSVTVCPPNTPTVYNFIGNGDWNTPSNWQNNIVGPKTIPAGVEVIIDPSTGGQCNYTGYINVQDGGKLTVRPGKVLNLMQ